VVFQKKGSGGNGKQLGGQEAACSAVATLTADEEPIVALESRSPQSIKLDMIQLEDRAGLVECIMHSHTFIIFPSSSRS